MKFCTKCGKQLPEAAMFCDRCGQQTQSVQPVQTIPPRDLQQEKTVRRNRGVGVVLILAAVALVVAVILMAIAQYNR